MYKGDVMNMILPPPTNEGFLALLSWGQKDIWMGGGVSFHKMEKWGIVRSGNANEPPGTLGETPILIILCGRSGDFDCCFC